jgi:hypothetical protein
MIEDPTGQLNKLTSTLQQELGKFTEEIERLSSRRFFRSPRTIAVVQSARESGRRLLSELNALDPNAACLLSFQDLETDVSELLKRIHDSLGPIKVGFRPNELRKEPSGNGPPAEEPISVTDIFAVTAEVWGFSAPFEPSLKGMQTYVWILRVQALQKERRKKMPAYLSEAAQVAPEDLAVDIDLRRRALDTLKPIRMSSLHIFNDSVKFTDPSVEERAFAEELIARLEATLKKRGGRHYAEVADIDALVDRQQRIKMGRELDALDKRPQEKPKPQNPSTEAELLSQIQTYLRLEEKNPHVKDYAHRRSLLERELRQLIANQRQ